MTAASAENGEHLR